MTPSLIIAGREISIVSWLDFDQAIEWFGGASTRRKANGSAFKMSKWRKARVTLSASGWIPAPLASIDYTQPFLVELPYPEAFAVGDVLPDGLSARTAPWAEHSVTDQAGSTVRLVYLKFTAISDGPRKTHGNSSSPTWELVLEQN